MFIGYVSDKMRGLDVRYQKKFCLNDNLKLHEFNLKLLPNVASNPVDCLCIWQVINIADCDVFL